MSVAWIAFFVNLAISRHETIRSHRFDLGNMVQAVWSTAHGHPLETTLASGEQMSRLGIHVDPILALFAPLWLLFPTPLVLIIAQAVALGVGALPVAWLARRHLDSEVAAGLCAAMYLFYVPIAWNTINDFHPVTLAVPLLLFAIWFLDGGRIIPFVACAALALMTNELIGLGVGALGVWYAFARKQWRIGLPIAFAGLAWTALCLKVIVPSFSGGQSSVFYGRFEKLGGSPEGLGATLVTHPMTVASAAFTWREFFYLFYLAAPLLLIFVWSPLALVALPQLAVNTLADNVSARLPEYQYSAGVVPYFVMATVLGLRRFPPRTRPLAALAVLAASVFVFAIARPHAGFEPFVYASRDSSSHLGAIRAAIRKVPSGARVSTTNRIGGQMSDRLYIFSFPVRAHADWVVVDRRDPWLAIAGERDAPALFKRELAQIRSDRRFTLVYERSDVLVYRRTQSLHESVAS